jgi:putative heme-binding domain-containing protein
MKSLLSALLLAVALVLPAAEVQTSAVDDLLAEVGGAEPDLQRSLLAGIVQGMLGQRSAPVPAAWAALAPKLAESPNARVRLTAYHLGALFGDAAAVAALRGTLKDTAAPAVERRIALRALLHVRANGLAGDLQGLLSDASVRANALRGLGELDDALTPSIILVVYGKLTVAERRDALGALTSRVAYAKALTAAIDRGAIPVRDLTASTLRQLTLLKDPALVAFAATHGGGNEKDPLAEVERLKGVVAATPGGDAVRGRALFERTCAQCHLLFGAGGNLGPDLTGLNRPDLDWVLKNVLDPTIIMGKEQQVVVARGKDGRVVAGMRREDSAAHIALQNENGTFVIPRSEIAELEETNRSTMPDGLLRPFTPAELKDLLTYLQGTAQVEAAAAGEPKL